jgi:hypothetical protein
MLLFVGRPVRSRPTEFRGKAVLQVRCKAAYLDYLEEQKKQRMWQRFCEMMPADPDGLRINLSDVFSNADRKPNGH